MSSFPPLQTQSLPTGEEIATRDFSQDVQSPTRAVHYDLEAAVPEANTTGHRRSSVAREGSPTSPTIHRRRTRADTFKSTHSMRTIDETPLPPYHQQPGQEPGLDPSKENGGRPEAPTLHADCQITVVDFSESDMEMHDFDNAGFIDWITKPQESWIKCRWISVNGLSWDVIQALGLQKGLHRLAIEDLVNPNNRTKADW